MADKTYVLVTVEDSCLDETHVIGGGDVEVITIDWDEITDDPGDAEDKLGEVVTAIDNIKTQGRKDTAELEKVELRLREIVADFEEDDEEEECEDCGELLSECECEDEGDFHIEEGDEDWDEDDVVGLGPDPGDADGDHESALASAGLGTDEDYEHGTQIED